VGTAMNATNTRRTTRVERFNTNTSFFTGGPDGVAIRGAWGARGGPKAGR